MSELRVGVDPEFGKEKERRKEVGKPNISGMENVSRGFSTSWKQFERVRDRGVLSTEGVGKVQEGNRRWLANFRVGRLVLRGEPLEPVPIVIRGRVPKAGSGR